MDSLHPISDLGTNINLTKEEFNLFHSIDRQIFTRLVVSLNRDISQCINVMAFIIWLERSAKGSQLMANLIHWPDNLLNDLAEESVLALKCIENAQFPFASDKFLPLIDKISRGSLTLHTFNENRLKIIPAITNILDDVCIRAFTDIMQQVQHEKAMKQQQNLNVPNYFGTMPNPTVVPVFHYVPTPVGIVPQRIDVPVATQLHNPNLSPSDARGNVNLYNASSRIDFRNELNEDLQEILANIPLNGVTLDHEMMKEVPADDRSIIMTFSKGYTISEFEIRDFFVRAHGDIIEAIHMQDVLPMEQPLFARIVFRTEAMNMIDSFFESTSGVKISINGKHVWAERYVPKDNKSPMATFPIIYGAPSP